MPGPLIGVLRRQRWNLAAAAAGLLLLVLALHSPDRQKGLAEHEAGGAMRHIASADVMALQIVDGARRQGFERRAGAWHKAEGGAAADAATSSAIEAGLRLLRNTAPERGFDTAPPEFGLDPPALRVRVQASDGRVFEAEFGATNPMGLARYARVRGAEGTSLQLMPAYVAEAWEQAARKGAP